MGEAKRKSLEKSKRLDRLLIIVVNSIAIITIPLWAWAYIWGSMLADRIKGVNTHIYDDYFWK